MCGIMAAALGEKDDVTPVLIKGLEALEYRGYDSAGVAILDQGRQVSSIRVAGKVRVLRARVKRRDPQGFMGIAHTRWATHGGVAESNAHPHSAGGEIFVVHNGIIENYQSLRKTLEWEGHEFESETDSEVLTKLIYHHWREGRDMASALRRVMQQVHGSYALVALVGPEAALYGCLHGCPLVLGRSGDGERYLASDVSALVREASEVAHLHDGDIVRAAFREEQAWNELTSDAGLRFEPTPPDEYISGKGNYQHFTRKEIHDQPDVVRGVLAGVVSDDHVTPAGLGSVQEALAAVREVHLAGCGSAYYASLLGAEWLRRVGGLPASAHIASELRYTEQHPRDNTLLVAVSQSGETADTLGVLDAASQSGGYLSTLGLCNVAWSTMTRRVAHVLLTKAGREVSVLSTKAITAQALSLLLLAMAIAQVQRGGGRAGSGPPQGHRQLAQALLGLGGQIEETLQLCEDSGQLNPWVERMRAARSVFFLGRGLQYAVACEGALKLKEGSYIPAQAYPAGELKHGPLALIDEQTPTVAIVGSDPELAAKTISNINEIAARNGAVMLIAPQDAQLADVKGMDVLRIPATHPELEPFLQIVAMQVLAYQTALRSGTDIDQPRNLAKSVTVE